MHVVLRDASDRRRRTREECLLRGEKLVVILRLMKNGGLIAGVVEDARRDLAARIAIDTRRVDVEVSVNVCVDSECQLRHD